MPGKAITVEEFKEKQGKLRIIDIRDSGSFSGEGGNLPESENIPLHLLEHHTKNWNRFENLMVVCSDGSQSAEGQELLEKAGFVSVVRLEGGVGSWKEASAAG